MNTLILCLIFLLVSNTLYGQFRVVDSLSRAPIEGVHILYDKYKGLISNEDGYFEIPEFVKADTLYFSHISYQKKRVPLKQLSDTVLLKESKIHLGEVVVRNFNARDTIVKVIERIDSNYLNIPHNSFGFLRQSLQENSLGIELIEADFISYLKDYSSDYQAKVVEAKKTQNYSTAMFDIFTSGGVTQII